MRVEIITPQKVDAIPECRIVTLPGAMGSFSILDGHAPIASVLLGGEIVCDQSKHIAIQGGVVNARDNTVQIFTENIGS